MAQRSAGREGEERRRTFDRRDAVHVLDLGQQDRVRPAVRIDARQRQPGDGLDAAHAVNCREEGGDVQAVALRPGGPDALGRRDGVEDRAVHVEQQGAERAAGKGAFAHGRAGTRKAASVQPDRERIIRWRCHKGRGSRGINAVDHDRHPFRPRAPMPSTPSWTQGRAFTPQARRDRDAQSTC